MAEPRVFRNDVWEVGPKWPTARVVKGPNSEILVQADITAIALKVFDESAADPDAVIFQTNRTIASTIFNTLQTWDLDATGFNFQDQIKTNEVTLEGAEKIRLSYLLTTSDGQIPVVFEWRIRHLLSE